MAVDGNYIRCSYTSPSSFIPSTPMFLIIQTQTVALQELSAVRPCRLRWLSIT